jgi:amidophosphoribosyltransferase
MSTEEELIANQMSLEDLKTHLGVDSLAYLSVDDMKQAVVPDATSPEREAFINPCMACFNNSYPAGKPKSHTKSTTPSENTLTEALLRRGK